MSKEKEFICSKCGERPNFNYGLYLTLDKEIICENCVRNFYNDQEKQIADLEAKLAEKDKAIENWQTMYQSVMQSCHNGIEEDKRLREQLAEKEKELEEVKKSKTYIMNFGNKVKEVQVVDDNQDKISFALEQLEKVKEDENLYEIMFEYLNNQGVKIKGVDYWCLLDVPDDIKNNSIEFEQQFKEVYKSMFDTYFDGIIYDLTHQHEDKGE